jgi:hypothetical protein
MKKTPKRGLNAMKKQTLDSKNQISTLPNGALTGWWLERVKWREKGVAFVEG